ncbi:LytR/AlgR family response regulator transcription factor [Priestia megaterium]|uniref:LytR/AlgR family response regulator transcription factor n=1 Tax=Priestia megaterium TaxID=1404 RepID=UPI002079EE96|nr:LytTR family DNA-binding domain-containing protein [Priestia megaterium]USL45843.1 LytTR family DNA-binding domain-containing protein [Priestia megaterium]
MYRAMVAEDDKDLRLSICEFIESNGYRVIAQIGDGKEAFRQIQRNKPEVLFIDIDLPNMSGIEVAKKAHAQFPHLAIVFITGYREYAYEAFEIDAVDYLIKPFNYERFYDCFRKIDLYLNKEKERMQFLAIQNRKSLELVNYENIMYIASENKCTSVYVFEEKKVRVIRTSETLKEMEARLDHDIFVRTHRSYIVNIKYIKRIDPSGQSYIIYLNHTSSFIYLSKTYLPSLYTYLCIKNKNNKIGSRAKATF